MAEVLQRPANQFTSETGRQAAYISNESQAALREDGLRFRELALEQAKQPKEANVDSDVSREVARQIDLANELITHARERINDKEHCYCDKCKRGGIDDKAKAALMREIRGFQEHICMLRGIAPVKPGRQSSVQRPPVTAPVVAPTQPVVVAPYQGGVGPVQST